MISTRRKLRSIGSGNGVGGRTAVDSVAVLFAMLGSSEVVLTFTVLTIAFVRIEEFTVNVKVAVAPLARIGVVAVTLSPGHILNGIAVQPAGTVKETGKR